MNSKEFILSISFNINQIKTKVYNTKIIISAHNVDRDFKKFEEIICRIQSSMQNQNYNPNIK